VYLYIFCTATSQFLYMKSTYLSIMKIGIISDSHDHIENLKTMVGMLKQKGVDTLFHCGDFCAPFMMAELDKFGVPVHAVFGNTDDRYMTPAAAAKTKNVKFYGDMGELVLAEKKIAFTHFPEFAFGLASTGKYDLVFHGHTHKTRDDKVGNCRLINPGEIMGRTGMPTCALYDTETDNLEFLN